MSAFTGLLPQIPEGIKQAILAQRKLDPGMTPANPPFGSPIDPGMTPPSTVPPVPTTGVGSGQNALRSAMMPSPAPVQPVAPDPSAGVQPAATQAPPPSDDPTIAMPTLPTPPDMSNSPLTKFLQQRQQTQDQLNAIPKPDPAKLRPKLWERLVGIALGATQLKNPENAGAVAGAVVNRRFNQATSDYAEKTNPLYKQLKSENEGMSAAEAADKIPQQDFENKLHVAEEGRQQVDAKARNSRFAAQSKKYENSFVAGTEKQDPSSPTGWSAQTFNDEWKPWTPKDASKAQKEPKTWQEAESMASAETDPVNKKRLQGLAKEFKTADDRKTNLEHPPKEPKEDKTDANGYTPSEAKQINSRTRTAHKELDALAQQRASFGAMPDSDFTKKSLAKIDARMDDLNKQIDAAEDDVLSKRKGGTTEASVKTETKTMPAKSAAAGAPPASLWKGKETKVLTLKGPDGQQKKWKLSGGQPVPLS